MVTDLLQQTVTHVVTDLLQQTATLVVTDLLQQTVILVVTGLLQQTPSLVVTGLLRQTYITIYAVSNPLDGFEPRLSGRTSQCNTITLLVDVSS